MPLVSYEQRDNVAIVRMDDGKANALSYDMMDALDAALSRAEKEAAAVVLTGRPGKFCAGFDLKEMMAGPDQARALVTRGADALMRLYTLPLPLIVAATGHALAGGALVVLTGDVRLAAKGLYRIGLNEVQIGMPVPVLAMELARDRLDPKHLIGSTLFATVVDPEAAVTAGWVDEAVDEDALVDRALTHATKLAALPRDAFSKTKVILRERTVKYVRDMLETDMKRLTVKI
ncbi:MAG: crotonase/enoyl-CoA hydratase family protein [Deltaproteobacteria bacterium]|nr:crotonase/enoyl-CoA hydratase family protein [Deltaproteobacteria bacterium]